MGRSKLKNKYVDLNPVFLYFRAFFLKANYIREIILFGIIVTKVGVYKCKQCNVGPVFSGI